MSPGPSHSWRRGVFFLCSEDDNVVHFWKTHVGLEAWLKAVAQEGTTG